MAKNKKAKSPVQKLNDLPKKYFPRNQPKASLYRDEIIDAVESLFQNYLKVNHAATVSLSDIGSIYKQSRITPPREVVFRGVNQFRYHYENYCQRTFSYRDKLLQFLNLMLKINLPEKKIYYSPFCDQSILRKTSLLSTLNKFKKDKILNRIISDRKLITHRRYYGVSIGMAFQPLQDKEIKSEKEFRDWCKRWQRAIKSREEYVHEATKKINKMNEEVVVKLINAKQKKWI